MSWIYYLLEANLYLAAFYALYYFLFRNETHYQLNRAYLLCCTIMAFAIPVIKVGFLDRPAVQLQDVVITTANISQPKQLTLNTVASPRPVSDYLLLAYALITGILLLTLCVKIYRLLRLSYLHKAVSHPGFKLIELPDENNAFSFFNYLFVSPGLGLSSTVIHHELVHIRQKHSWDILYFELIKVLCWFNPVIWLMQGSLKELHEFIADSQTVGEETGPGVYTDFLINNAYGITENTLINTFFNQSLLKKRIMKLHQKRSGKAARLKYLLVLPLVAGLLCASTLAFAKTYSWIDLAPGRAAVVKPDTTHAVKKTVRLSVDKNRAITKKENALVKKEVSKDVKQEIVLVKAREVKLNRSPKNPPVKVISVDVDTTRLPPPPPPLPPADVKPPAKANINPPVPPKKAKPVQVKLLPPTVWNESFGKLAPHLSRNIHYPADARDHGIVGNVIAQFTVTDDHKITGMKIISGIGYGCEEEVMRALRSFDDTMDKPAGDYVFAVSYRLMSENGGDKYTPKVIDPALQSQPNFLGQVTITSYVE